MLSKMGLQEFKFKSTVGGKILLWLSGIAPILLSAGLFRLFLAPSQVTGQNLLSIVVFEVLLWILGCVILVSACEIQIVDGQLRFRRVFHWRSVPLKSITRVRVLPALGVYVRVDYGGKRFRLLFYPGNSDAVSPLPVTEFLEQLSGRKVNDPESRPPTEKSPPDFKFKSSLVGAGVTKSLGLPLIWVSIDFLDGWLTPSWDRLPYMIFLLPFGLFFLGVGVMVLLNACQIEIVEGQLRYRRALDWNTVPLESITKFRLLWGPAAYLRVEHAGKIHRLIISPEDYKLYLHTSPIIGFLREVCRRNAEKLASSA